MKNPKLHNSILRRRSEVNSAAQKHKRLRLIKTIQTLFFVFISIPCWSAQNWITSLSDGSITSLENQGIPLRAVTVYGNDVIVGGAFSTIDGASLGSATNVARWNGFTWSTMGSGTSSSTVNALASASDGVFAGGGFTSPANYLAKWDGSSWNSISGGQPNGFIYAMVNDGANLYVSGDFSTVGATAARGIAKLNGSTWTALGSGLSYITLTDPGYCSGMAVAQNGDLFVCGGVFTAAGGTAAGTQGKGFAKWDGSSWSIIGGYTENTYNFYPRTLAAQGNDIYIGGGFGIDFTGGTSFGIAKYNSSSGWTDLNEPWTATPLPVVNAIVFHGTDLYVGGKFNVSGVGYRYLYKFDGTTWTPIDGLNGEVRAMAISGHDLYLTGDFTQAGGATANHLVKLKVVRDLNAEFSLASNPGPDNRWRYGYMTTLGGSFTAVTVQYNGSTADDSTTIPSWQYSSSLMPAFYINNSDHAVTVGSGAATLQVGDVWFYPGDDGSSRNYGVIRYTVPSGESGLYQLMGRVEAVYLSLGDGDTDFHILVNGTEIVDYDLPAGGSAGFVQDLSLTAGDTIDFAVGRGDDASAYASGLKIRAFFRNLRQSGSFGNSYSPNIEFSTASNPDPNGHWGYGYKSTTVGSYTALTVQYNGSTADDSTTIPSWQYSSSLSPAVYWNPAAYTVTTGSGAATFVPEALWFYPGDDGSSRNFGVIRFVVPSGQGGTYSLGAAIESVYLTLGSGDTDFHIVKNGVEIYTRDIAAGASAVVSDTVKLDASDTVDFVVGRGADTSAYASGLKSWIQMTKLP